MNRVLPILFNTEMVTAILEGRKTVTRRVIDKDISNHFEIDVDGKAYLYIDPATWDRYLPQDLCRYQKGDTLYVRETWCNLSKEGIEPEYYYFADTFICEDYNKADWKWRPSIHMPKKAARIWLKVTDVRVEKLQKITEEQAVREGIMKLYDNLSDSDYISWAKRTGVYPKSKKEWGYKNYLWHGNFGRHGTGSKMSDAWEYQYSSYDRAIDSFSSLWNTTVPLKKWKVFGWDANPWVWVIEFEQCRKDSSICIIK